MPGNSFGQFFKITSWGESHGKALGVVVDGCPAGIKLNEKDIQTELDKRKPGQSRFTTPRKESDKVQILSGTFKGKTTGTPISMLIMNIDAISKSYSNFKDIYRPGHADLSYDVHIYSNYTLIALISLHILAALLHTFVFKDNVIKRIT